MSQLPVSVCGSTCQAGHSYLCQDTVPQSVDNLVLELLTDRLVLPGPGGPHHLPRPGGTVLQILEAGGWCGLVVIRETPTGQPDSLASFTVF
jgi:hypothetical protein